MSDREEQFVAVPTDQTVLQDETAVFLCQHSSADAVGFRLNDERITNLTNIGINSMQLDDGGVLHVLSIVANPKYNLSDINCVALFFDGSPVQSTSAAQLTIQGLQECCIDTFMCT